VVYGHLFGGYTFFKEQESWVVWLTMELQQSYFEPRLQEALTQQTNSGSPITVPFVIYNMPDRDCSSTASIGELTFANNGLSRYRGMIDTISATIDRYSSLTFAIILEPDSVGNIVTNIGSGRCTASLADNYVAAYAYAVSKLQQPNVALYIDIAHSNWLGWPGNLSPSMLLAL
jgi:cellulose 1,4-beta-cellobiosidase